MVNINLHSVVSFNFAGIKFRAKRHKLQYSLSSEFITNEINYVSPPFGKLNDIPEPSVFPGECSEGLTRPE
jgi:hypothetical protein